jgi:hypothetical protein
MQKNRKERQKEKEIVVVSTRVLPEAWEFFTRHNLCPTIRDADGNGTTLAPKQRFSCGVMECYCFAGGGQLLVVRNVVLSWV